MRQIHAIVFSFEFHLTEVSDFIQPERLKPETLHSDEIILVSEVAWSYISRMQSLISVGEYSIQTSISWSNFTKSRIMFVREPHSTFLTWINFFRLRCVSWLIWKHIICNYDPSFLAIGCSQSNRCICYSKTTNC